MNQRNDKPGRGRRPSGASTPRRRTSIHQPAQELLPLRPPRTWGGKREGAGRKPAGRKAGVPHRPRPPLASRFPVHVTLRVRPEVWNLRSRRAFDHRIAPAIEKGKKTDAGFRLVHYSVQGNHLHFVCEGRDARVLARGIQGLAIRIAKGLNGMMGRTGTVFADRYHARILRTPREVRNVLAYVFGNFAKHWDEWMGSTPSDTPGLVDPYSSAGHFLEFPGRTERPTWGPRDPPPGAAPKTWLLIEGWRKAGPIALR